MRDIAISLHYTKLRGANDSETIRSMNVAHEIVHELPQHSHLHRFVPLWIPESLFLDWEMQDCAVYRAARAYMARNGILHCGAKGKKFIDMIAALLYSKAALSLNLYEKTIVCSSGYDEWQWTFLNSVDARLTGVEHRYFQEMRLHICAVNAMLTMYNGDRVLSRRLQESWSYICAFVLPRNLTNATDVLCWMNILGEAP